MKIHKKLVFNTGSLKNYLKTVKKLKKIDWEIISALTYQKAYEKIYEESTMIAFPYRENKESELNKMGIIPAINIGKFISKFSEESSPIDAIIINPEDNKQATIRPLQIKILGKGKYANVDNKKFIELLEENKKYEKNPYTLVIVLDGKVQRLKLREIVDWLKENEFPFDEVILINASNNLSGVELFQLKPTNKFFSSIKLSKKDIEGE